MSTQPMMFPSEWPERMAYERAKAGYWPYDIEDLRHFCALRDLRIEELKADNAKLRELLHEALLFGNERSYQEIRYRLKQQARELGVEVE